MEKLVNGALPLEKTNAWKGRFASVTGWRVAEEDSKDARWVKFEAGYHEFVVDSAKRKTPCSASYVAYAEL